MLDFILGVIEAIMMIWLIGALTIFVIAFIVDLIKNR